VSGTDTHARPTSSPRGQRPSTATDVHAHVVPPALLAEIAGTPGGVNGFRAERTEHGWVVDAPGMGRTRPFGAKMTDAGPRREWMDRTGVTAQVLSPWMDIQTARLSPSAARDWAQRLNDAMCATVAEFDGAAGGFATVALEDGDRAADDLRAAMTRPELVGLMLSTNPVGDVVLHDPRLDALWAAAEQDQVPIMLHPPSCGPSAALDTLNRMGNVYGRLVDNTLALTELILHGVLDRFPRLRLLAVHGGGFLPFQAGRLDGGFRTGESRAGSLERGTPSAYLGELFYDTVALSAPAVAFLTGLVGPRHVLLGSDYPFAIGDPEPVRTVRAGALPPQQEEAVLRTSAAELFGSPA
jgi:aminocarboxymuconate-semialdehyde decarboxylase